ncbi:MAG TPA: serine-type D-Ala-D-Ala carboxypeptidase, partial [Methylophaga sp.]|nr:serine-type D-Ala-D-Ala carboxypeptidase [Methylophaga sp.]
MIKLFKNLLASAVILTASTTSFAGAVVPKPVAPSIAAESYILMDHDSGKVLAESEATTRLPPASITKLMTSYV